MNSSFYHLWAGLENGAFLGYYKEGNNGFDGHTLAWQVKESAALLPYRSCLLLLLLL